MWLVDWFWSTLASLGLYGKRAKLVFVGLDNAGKTTLLNLLANDQLSAFTPTQKPTADEFALGGVSFTTHDLGGHQAARPLWFEYSVNAQGIIFLVDASDRERLQEAKQELDRLRADPTLHLIPLLVLANKVDLPDSVSERVLRDFFDIHEVHLVADGGGGGGRAPVALHLCSLIKRQGYKEGIQWLAQFI